VTNIDAFNQAAALVLHSLYEAFPQERALGPAAVSADTDAAVREQTAATIEFLLAEGFVRGVKTADGPLAPYRLTLTAKGLTVMNAVPDAVQAKTPVGQRLGAALRSGGREAVNAIIAQVVSAAASGRLPGM
jgi:hypothetical protein